MSGCQWSSSVPISTRQWQAALTLLSFGQQGLIDVRSTGHECINRRRHVQSPDTVGHFTGEFACFVAVGFQATYPVPERESIVLAQTLHITHLKAIHLGCLQGATDRNQRPIRKHIALIEGGGGLWWLGDHARNPVVKEDPTRT